MTCRLVSSVYYIMSTTAFQHEPGTAMECLSIPITLEKEAGIDEHGRQVCWKAFNIKSSSGGFIQ